MRRACPQRLPAPLLALYALRQQRPEGRAQRRRRRRRRRRAWMRASQAQPPNAPGMPAGVQLAGGAAHSGATRQLSTNAAATHVHHQEAWLHLLRRLLEDLLEPAAQHRAPGRRVAHAGLGQAPLRLAPRFPSALRKLKR